MYELRRKVKKQNINFYVGCEARFRCLDGQNANYYSQGIYCGFWNIYSCN